MRDVSEQAMQNSRDIFADYMAVINGCKGCKHQENKPKECPAWCYEFFREQFREIHEHAQSVEMNGGKYERLYI